MDERPKGWKGIFSPFLWISFVNENIKRKFIYEHRRDWVNSVTKLFNCCTVQFIQTQCSFFFFSLNKSQRKKLPNTRHHLKRKEKSKETKIIRFGKNKFKRGDDEDEGSFAYHSCCHTQFFHSLDFFFLLTIYTHTHTRDTLSSRGLGSLRSIRFDYSMFKHRRRKRKNKENKEKRKEK